MNKKRHEHKTLGELLQRARAAKGLTQVQVAQSVGISEVSLIRYEKAGLEKAGQHPPGPKLAALCAFLNIPPAQALFACLDDGHDWKEHGLSWHDLHAESPDFKFLLEDYKEVVNENRFLRSIIKALDEENDDYDEDVADWLYKQAKSLTRGDEETKYKMVEKGLYDGDINHWSIIFT